VCNFHSCSDQPSQAKIRCCTPHITRGIINHLPPTQNFPSFYILVLDQVDEIHDQQLAQHSRMGLL
jgi:hypothetical protein